MVVMVPHQPDHDHDCDECGGNGGVGDEETLQ